jgi:hypothetical protein
MMHLTVVKLRWSQKKIVKRLYFFSILYKLIPTIIPQGLVLKR